MSRSFHHEIEKKEQATLSLKKKKRAKSVSSYLGVRTVQRRSQDSTSAATLSISAFSSPSTPGYIV